MRGTRETWGAGCGLRDAGCERQPMGVGSCLAFILCLLGRAASKPQPALRAGDRLLARSVSLGPGTPSHAGLGAGVQVSHAGKGHVMLRISGGFGGFAAAASGCAH